MNRFIAKFTLPAWVGLCLAATIIALVLADLSTEQAAWATLASADVPVWAILSGIAIAWVRNTTF